jgi:2-keto-4-pentenoate hydratase
MSPEHIEEFGTALAHYRKLGIVAELRLDRIGSSEEADAVQAAAVEAYGGAPCGYSIQGTTALSRRLICCDEPIFGPLLDSDVALSGTSFRLPHGMLGAGCALSFVLARPYPLENEDISRDTVSRALASCRPAIELLGRRVPGSMPLNAYTTTADFALSVLHVQGGGVNHWGDLNLAGVHVSARLNGQVVGEGDGGDVLGHPLDAVLWLARALLMRGRELDAGDTVTTGTCTGILQVLPGQTLEADFGALGQVSVAFV